MATEKTEPFVSNGKPETRPFSIRLTEDERRLLLARAGRLPLGTYVRDVILAESSHAKRAR